MAWGGRDYGDDGAGSDWKGDEDLKFQREYAKREGERQAYWRAQGLKDPWTNGGRSEPLDRDPLEDRTSGESWPSPRPCPVPGCTLHYGPGQAACASHSKPARGE